ncbi:hypothetical protein Pmani_016380 [Petrolisthes manimaculis]|uniref:Uncharacterized protein n=1 Tax=Petrolisthes manimaculis TaxID=1843537 RepID=A0AAE1PP83_9EUCA|nr:hypothetical protein Pmani_016380 [Petrolisthes manimaculis]
MSVYNGWGGGQDKVAVPFRISVTFTESHQHHNQQISNRDSFTCKSKAIHLGQETRPFSHQDAYLCGPRPYERLRLRLRSCGHENRTQFGADPLDRPASPHRQLPEEAGLRGLASIHSPL